MLEELKEYLRSVPIGPVVDRTNLQNLLIECWDEFDRSDEGGMTADRLLGRMEEIYWNPPILSFIIERHGAYVRGSTRAEKQNWDLNLETDIATLSNGGYRQLRPKQQPMNIKPIADDIARLVVENQRDNQLEWGADGSVRILIENILPHNSAGKQTLTGRRKRFREEIEKLLTAQGWEKIGNYRYNPPKD